MLGDAESGYRAKIILLKDEGYTVPQIRKITNHHDQNIRKWIHSIDSMKKELMVVLCQKSTVINSINLINDIEKQIVDIASLNPRTSYGLGFSSWSLRILAGFIIYDLKLIDRISHTEIRNISFET